MKKIIKFFFFIILAIIIAVCGVVLIKGYNMYKEAIDETSIETMFSEIQEEENFVTIDEVPDIFINAVVSVEDKRFYEHNGVDIISIGRAIWTNIKTLELTEGGSTITQQIAKNLYFTQKKDFSRKVAEIFVAKDIEEIYSKEEILEIYINTNFYGSGYYGIYDAAMGYYNKEPSELSDYEATLLAGVPNAPSVYSPKVNLNLAEQRQSVVLEEMVNCRIFNGRRGWSNWGRATNKMKQMSNFAMIS